MKNMIWYKGFYYGAINFNTTCMEQMPYLFITTSQTFSAILIKVRSSPIISPSVLKLESCYKVPLCVYRGILLT